MIDIDDLRAEIAALRHRLDMTEQARDAGWRDVGRMMEEARRIDFFGTEGSGCRR